REFEGLIGFFVNTLPIRTDLRGDVTFLELVDRVHAATLEAHAHQGAPFDAIVQHAAPGRSGDRSPLAQVIFGFENFPTSPLALRDLAVTAVSPLDVNVGTAKAELEFFVREADGELTGIVEYDAESFRRTTIRQAIVRL